MSEKWQNESSPNFSNFCPEFPPEFCSEFSPNFSRSFRALFPRKRRPEKIHQKSPPFFNAKFPGNYEKNIHKMFLRASNLYNFLHRGQAKILVYSAPVWPPLWAACKCACDFNMISAGHYPPPAKKLLTQKKFWRNYFRGHCDNSA